MKFNLKFDRCIYCIWRMKPYWEIITLLHCMYLFFIRSPEQKAPMSFPGKKLSVVRCRRGYRKLFKFSSSSPEPLGQFQPDLAQNILACSNEGPRCFPRGDKYEISKIH